MGLFNRNDNGKVIRKNKDGSVERIYKDGIKEKRRTTKTRVVWDFERPDGVKGSIWQTKNQYLRGGGKKFWKD
mgnify:CR=1 FL=1